MGQALCQALKGLNSHLRASQTSGGAYGCCATPRRRLLQSPRNSPQHPTSAVFSEVGRHQANRNKKRKRERENVKRATKIKRGGDAFAASCRSWMQSADREPALRRAGFIGGPRLGTPGLATTLFCIGILFMCIGCLCLCVLLFVCFVLFVMFVFCCFLLFVWFVLF